MSHVQKQILDRVVSDLTGLSATGSRVYRSSEHPVTTATMPGLSVSLGEELAGEGSISATIKVVRLTVLVCVEGDDFDVSTKVLADIEAALYGDYSAGRYVAGLALSVLYRGCSREYVTSTAVRHTRLTVLYDVEYQTMDGAAETAC